MTKGNKSFILVWLSILAILLTLIASAAPSPAAQRTVKIGYMFDMSGPIAAQHAAIVKGIKAYWDWAKEHNPIPGLEVNTIFADTKYQIDMYMEAYRKYSTDPDVILVSASAQNFSKVAADQFAKDKIVYFDSSAAAQPFYPPKDFMYSNVASNPDVVAAAADWLLKGWKQKRPLRLGIIVADAAFGHIMDEGGTQYCKARGIEIVAEEPIPVMPTSTSTELRRIEKARADYIWLQHTDGGVAMVAKDAVRLGIKIPLLAANWTSELVIPLSGEAGDGLYMFQTVLTPAALAPKDLTPGQRRFLDIMKKYPGIDLIVDSNVQNGFPSSMIIHAALKEAVRVVGIQGLNRIAVNEAFKRLKDVDTCDIYRIKGYTASDHRGSNMVRVGQLRGGVLQIVDFFETPYVTVERCVKSNYVKPVSWVELGVK